MLGGYSRHVLIELRNILSEKVWESWRMPQVEASFTFDQQIHEKDAPKGTENSAAIVARLNHVGNPNTSATTQLDTKPRPVLQSDYKRSEQHARSKGLLIEYDL